MNKVFPIYNFDSHLREVPNEPSEWIQFLDELKILLKDENNSNQKLSLFENIGMAARILQKLGEAEYYLNKAVTLSYDQLDKSKLVQNLIRLAHVYQWQNQFTKAHVLFDQARSLIHQYDINESIKASYHQHLGKCYFDQKFYALALTEFELAFKIRQRLSSPKDQIESSINAVDECKKRTNWAFSSDFTIRRAEVSDAEPIHNAHMKSIQEICSKDHNPEEIRVWGGRSYNPDFRIPPIKEQFYLVVEYKNKVEGFAQLSLDFKDSKKTAYLYGFYITPAILHQKIGSHLMQLVFEYCKCHQAKEIDLISSLTAFDFYKKHGFIQNGEMSGLIRDGVTIRGYPMKKELT